MHVADFFLFTEDITSLLWISRPSAQSISFLSIFFLQVFHSTLACWPRRHLLYTCNIGRGRNARFQFLSLFIKLSFLSMTKFLPKALFKYTEKVIVLFVGKFPLYASIIFLDLLSTCFQRGKGV